MHVGPPKRCNTPSSERWPQNEFDQDGLSQGGLSWSKTTGMYLPERNYDPVLEYTFENMIPIWDNAVSFVSYSTFHIKFDQS